MTKAFKVRYRIRAATTVRSVRVYLDGRRRLSTKKSRFSLTINTRRLRAGRHRLKVVVTDTAGFKTTSTRSFSVGRTAKPKRKSRPRFTG